MKGSIQGQWAVNLFVILAVVRLFSVRSERAEKLVDNRPREESRMRNLNRMQVPVVFKSTMLETIWACGAGWLGSQWAT